MIHVRVYLALAALGLGTLLSSDAQAFCGFYVAKADTKLFNKASKVVMARHDNKTVITMANDYQGSLKEFAIVVPVPTFIEEGQIHVGDRGLVDHLDAYTAPRLVEYHDPDPCRVLKPPPFPAMLRSMRSKSSTAFEAESAADLGVTIEATYTVGEYDILILSAKESNGLQQWLEKNDYKMPKGAAPILGSYIKQEMRFFVAKVNIEKQSALGFTYLRPLQVAFESPKFMLPIRLGTLNANGTQELFVFALTRHGRVETTNYRTVKLPTGMDIPVYVKSSFGDFYSAMFTEQVRRESMRTVFLEYAWNMSWCDPCAADPLSNKQLRELGAFWVGSGGGKKNMRSRRRRGGPQNAYVTRLHVRYDAEHFPEDLVFQETKDTSNFQGRYVLRHPFTGNLACDAGQRYKETLVKRNEKEAGMLASLTGWDVNSIRRKMGLSDMANPKSAESKSWWQNLWGD